MNIGEHVLDIIGNLLRLSQLPGQATLPALSTHTEGEADLGSVLLLSVPELKS